MQTGLADTFQLTLGGVFGNGPAWQTRLTSGLGNAFVKGDSISIYGWDTRDSEDHINNWQAGLGYKLPLFAKRNHTIVLGSGLQRWLFPSVKTGTNDWLVPGYLAYEAKVRRFSVNVTEDSWTILKTTLTRGSLLHTQAWLKYRLLNREHLQIGVKTGPAHTYSWNFYGTNGNRVFRWQAMLEARFGTTLIEGGYRKQWGLQPGICDNRYWQFAVTESFTRRVKRPAERQ